MVAQTEEAEMKEVQINRSGSEVAATEPMDDAVDKTNFMDLTSDVPESMSVQPESPADAPVELEPAPVEPESSNQPAVEPASASAPVVTKKLEDKQKDCHGRILIRYNMYFILSKPNK